jgi:phosphohistidine phosphatase
MQIYLLRHAIAEDPRAGLRDPDRRITREGFDRLGRVLAVARRAGVAPSLIASSPYRRAVETARAAAKELRYGGEILAWRSLTPESSPEAVWDDIRAHGAGVEQLLLAGHEPLFSALAAFLLGEPSLSIDFKKAGLLRVDLPRLAARPRGILEWYLTPKLAAE